MLPLELDRITTGAVVLLGVPSDENSSLLRGPAAAPDVIRSALFDPGMSLGTEDGGNLADEPRLVDVGNLRLPDRDGDARFASIVEQVAAVRGRGASVLALGGDHAVSYPLVRAHAAGGKRFSIVQVDAHPDLYDSFDDNRYSHASGFARIMEEGLADRLVQVGIRAATPHQREQAERFGVEMFYDDADLPDGPTYLSFDLDGIDPAFAPGVSHPEAGGLTTREAVRLIQRLPGPLIGADLVELNPRRDVAGATALVAAKLAREILGRLLG